MKLFICFKVLDNCSSENKSQYRLAEIASEVIPTTVIFKTQDHSKSTVDGLHTWCTSKIRAGNQKDRAQTLSDAIEYLREEEEKKTHGKIKRFFIASEHFDEPRKGLQNSDNIQNHLIRMCSYDSNEVKILFTDIPCDCINCVFGEFKNCSNHEHNIVTGKISKSRSKPTNRAQKTNEIDFDQEELDISAYTVEWDKNIDQLYAKDHYESDDSYESDSNDETPENFNPDVSTLPKNSKSNQQSAIIIEDDGSFWENEIKFKQDLKKWIANSGPFESLLDNSTIEKCDLGRFSGVWNLINCEDNNQTDYQIGNTTEINRGTLQLCYGSRWFSVLTMDLAFKNIEFRSSLVNKKVIALKYEFLYELKVTFILYHKVYMILTEIFIILIILLSGRIYKKLQKSIRILLHKF